jgi:GGDEF domain-containing protein
MFRPQNKGLNPIRLSKLSTLPGFEDVFHCLQECQKNKGRTIELPWNAEKPARDCMLSVSGDRDGNEPVWSFYAGNGDYSEQRWSYQSGDIGLITNLIVRECLGDDSDMKLGQDQTSSHIAVQRPDSNGKSGSSSGAHNQATSQPLGQLPRNGNGTNQRSSQSNQSGSNGGQGYGRNQSQSQQSISQNTSGSHQAPGKEKEKRHATLEGDLQNMKAPNLLQSVGISKMTGLLNVTNNEEKIEVFFEEGLPSHAVSADSRGEAAITELLTWDDGVFAFYPNDRSGERTIFKRTENLLMEAAPLIDQYRFLNQTGVTMNTYFVRKFPNLSEVEFEQRVSRGAKADLLKQKQLYQLIDNQSNLFEILRKMPLSKVEWISSVYNLIVCDLVALSDKAAHVKKVAPIEAMGIDRSAISVAMKNMMRSETGLINYPVILYFLEQEYFRWEHTGAPFSLMVFEMRQRTATGLEPLPLPAIKEAARRINDIKRNIDQLAHFETFGFLLLLPYTRVQAASMVARRVSEVLWDQTRGGVLDSSNLALAIGIAGIPEDCQDLGMLLSAAKDAMNTSKKTGNPVVIFGNR